MNVSSSKIGNDFSNKEVQKLTIEKNAFNKKWSPKLIFFDEKRIKKIPSIFDIKNCLCNYNFGTFCQPVIHQQIFF